MSLWQLNFRVVRSFLEEMKLLRFAGVVFIFILAFQFVNIHYYGGDILSLSSQDEFPVSIHGSTEPIRPLSGPERLNVSSSISAEVSEGERTGLGEDYVISSDANVSVQSHDAKDKETLDLLLETRSSMNGSDADIVNENNRNVEILESDDFVEDAKDKDALDSLLETRSSSSNGSYGDVVEDAEIVNENNRNVETLETRSDDNLSPEVKRVMNVSVSGVVSISEMMSLLHQSRTTHVSLVCGLLLVSTTTTHLCILLYLLFSENETAFCS